MLTHPRFVRACYAFFAVAVLAAVLKLSVSGAEPGFLKMLPAAPSASVAEAVPQPPESPEDPRLVSFSGDDEAERLQRIIPREDARASSRKGVLAGSNAEGAGPPGDAPVFRRPSSAPGLSPDPVCGDLGDEPGSSRVVFPLPNEYFNSYDDTWGAARPQGGHEGSDLMSPSGTPEFALTDGRLVAVAGSNENGWNRLGGYTVMLEAAYDIGPIKKGDLFYYAHMDRESSLPIGTEVRAGQRIGAVGDTGEGREGTRGKFPPHLHLGWYDAELSEDRSGTESGAMDPYPLLTWLESNGGAVTGGTDASYCQAPQSPNPVPSTGEPNWPIPSGPGERPDLDTGRDDASPAARNDDRAERKHPKRDHGTNHNSESGDAGEGVSEEGGNGEEASDSNEAANEPQNEATRPSLSKKLRARLKALLRDLPGATLDRSPPQDHGGEQHNGENEDGAREDGTQNVGEQGERPGNAARPEKERPETGQDAPAGETTKPAPVVPVPDPQTRPAPEKPVEEAVAEEKRPEADETPDVRQEVVLPEPVRASGTRETGTTEGATPPRRAAMPLRNEPVVDAPGRETVVDVGSREGK